MRKYTYINKYTFVTSDVVKQSLTMLWFIGEADGYLTAFVTCAFRISGKTPNIPAEVIVVFLGISEQSLKQDIKLGDECFVEHHFYFAYYEY